MRLVIIFCIACPLQIYSTVSIWCVLFCSNCLFLSCSTVPIQSISKRGNLNYLLYGSSIQIQKRLSDLHKKFQFYEKLCFKEKPKIMSFCSISLSDLATCSFKFISLHVYICRRKRELIILYIKRPGKTCGHIPKEAE